MYGVPKNLPLRKLHGLSVLAIRPLENIIYFDLGRDGETAVEIGVESRWELRCHERGAVIAGNPIPPDLNAASSVVGATVTGSSLRHPESFVLMLDESNELEVFDSDSRYESFSIPQWNVYV